MAKSKKQNYSIDAVKKTITATISELDAVEKEIVQMYINAGYILHKGKSNPWNKKTIIAWLKKYSKEEDAKTFEKKCVDDGWVSARKWFFEKYTENKRKELEDGASKKAE